MEYPTTLRGRLKRYTVRSALLCAVVGYTVLGSAGGALAADPGGSGPAYLDDRSSGESLIRSLYNAIDRHEYLRAYSYFGEAADRPDFESFAKGYATTDHVRLKLGEITGEGAAGSLYTNVPAAIEATDTDGTSEVFTGCYVTRLAQPSVQATPPFQPIHIEKASLERATQSFDAAKPVCPEQ